MNDKIFLFSIRDEGKNNIKIPTLRTSHLEFKFNYACFRDECIDKRQLNAACTVGTLNRMKIFGFHVFWLKKTSF